MNMLFLCSRLDGVGGIQRYNRELLKALGASGANVTVVERRAKATFVAKVLWKRFRTKPDIVLCGHIHFSPLCPVMKRLLGGEFAVITHGIEAWNIRNAARLKALEKARLIISVSEYTKGELARQLPGTEEKIFVLPNSVDGEKFTIKEKPEYLVKRHGLAGAKVLLTVSRLSEDEVGFKGYDRVIEVLPNVLKSVPNAKYLLVGDGGDIPRVKRLAEKLGLGDRVVFAGRAKDDELADYYNVADVYVMPSICEGFGIVFLEALASGVPVVAGNRDASREAVTDKRWSRLVDPESTEEISEAVVSVLSGTRTREERETLRKSALERYGIDAFRKKVKTLLSGIIQQITPKSYG